MILYFSTEYDVKYSVFLSLDWLEDYIANAGLGDIEDFLENYNSKDVEKIINALDENNEPYTIQLEHQFSGFC